MKYTPRPFDNSEEAIKNLADEHSEAKEFVFGWMQDTGLLTEDHCISGLDFDDIFHLMAEYKRSILLTPIVTP